MRWKWGASAAFSAALVSAVLVAAGCSSLLGLGDFKDQKADASAGNGGSDAGGAGGSAPEAGAGAGGTDGGGHSCTLDEAPFTIMKPAETGGVTPHQSMFVAEDVKQSQVYVVVGAEDGSSVLIQRVTDHAGSGRLGTLVSYSPQQGNAGVNSMFVTGAEVRNGALHVTGYGYDLASHEATGIDLVFTSNGPDLAPTPNLNKIPLPCATGAQVPGARFRWDAAGTPHYDYAVTCAEPSDAGADAGTTWDLFVDGIKIDSMTPGDHNVQVAEFALWGKKQYILLTGEAPTEGGIYYGTLPPTGAVSRVPLRFSKDANQISHALRAWPVTSGISLFGLQVEATVTDAGVTLGTPAYFWQGVFTNAQLGDLANAPPLEMKKIQTLGSVGDFVLYSEPRMGALGAVMAGASIVGDAARFSLYSPAGAPLVVAQQAAKVDTSTGDQILDAAAGPLGTLSLVVVWDVQTPGPDGALNSMVKGQVYFCN